MRETKCREVKSQKYYETKRSIASMKFTAIRNGNWNKEDFGHDLSIAVLQRHPDGTVRLTQITPRHSAK